MVVRHWFRVPCVGLLTLAVGCRDSAAPLENLSGIFVLSRSGDQVLPLTYGGTSVIADTLRLNADGTGSQTQVTGPPHARSAFRPVSHRAIGGDRVEIVIGCAMDEYCTLHPKVARVINMGIWMPSSWDYREPDWEYDRVEPGQ
jgi:hypothetical protein